MAVLLAVGALACASKPALNEVVPVADLNPPVAAKKDKKLTQHGDVRIDPYYWLNERENPEVLAYLAAENRYLESVMKDTESLQKSLFEEMKSHIKQDDASVPQKEGEFLYYSRFETGKEYPIYCRKRDAQKNPTTAPEEVILDVNELAKGHNYFSVHSVFPSPDGKLLAFAEDSVGRRLYTLHFKDLGTGKMLKDEVTLVTGNYAWANDNKTIFYSKQDVSSLRWQWIYRHELGQSKDTLIYDEKDETFEVSVGKSLSEKFIFVNIHSTLSTEVRYLSADEPGATLEVFEPRGKEHEYDVEDGGDRFFIRTNLDAKNFKIMEAPYGKTARKNWKNQIAHRADTLVESFIAFKTHLVLQERKNGLTRLEVINRKSKKRSYPKFKDPTYAAEIGGNREFDSKWFRYGYESMTTPESVIELNLQTGKQVVRKVKEVPGGFKSSNYKSERRFARAKDGTKIPISLVYRKGTRKKPTTPLFIYAYGSYGHSSEPHFGASLLSLLDRGFVFAIAHVRGGSEMGRYWYEDGRQMKKKNTFTDFIACTEYLQKQGFSSPEHTFANGGSAGGLLMGAILNMRPDLYRGIAADVPFVDVVTTMLDTSLPLTTAEFDEWGNPANKAAYNYIKSYSPYDNVVKKSYTNVLVTTGLHDSQVQYFEPAKWVARLRAMKTDPGLVLFRTNMEAGHGGKSGRFERLKEIALKYAFFLKLQNN